jgi:hypothetical protein
VRGSEGGSGGGKSAEQQYLGDAARKWLRPRPRASGDEKPNGDEEAGEWRKLVAESGKEAGEKGEEGKNQRRERQGSGRGTRLRVHIRWQLFRILRLVRDVAGSGRIVRLFVAGAIRRELV